MRKLVHHFVPRCHDYYIPQKIMNIFIYKSGDQHDNKLADNDFNYNSDHFVVPFLNLTYYAGIIHNYNYA